MLCVRLRQSQIECDEKILAEATGFTTGAVQNVSTRVWFRSLSGMTSKRLQNSHLPEPSRNVTLTCMLRREVVSQPESTKVLTTPLVSSATAKSLLQQVPTTFSTGSGTALLK